MLSKSRSKSKTPKGSVEGAELNGERSICRLLELCLLACRLQSMVT